MSLGMMIAWSTCYAQEGSVEKPHSLEYYYSIKLGYVEEWLELYKKYHLPIMLAEKEAGLIENLEITRSMGFAPDGHHWDVRVLITSKNIFLAHGLEENNRDPVIEKLFPDREEWEEGEKRRKDLIKSLRSVEVYKID
jgi:hypothetical protein